uniref:Uncharacterized protein n=1 Tax=Cacopsylla melanoneura TaxID=428564 RepID=A0A8D8Y5B5_9HEMI
MDGVQVEWVAPNGPTGNSGAGVGMGPLWVMWEQRGVRHQWRIQHWIRPVVWTSMETRDMQVLRLPIRTVSSFVIRTECGGRETKHCVAVETTTETREMRDQSHRRTLC